MKYVVMSVLVLSAVACSGKQKEVATKRVNELIVTEKNTHLSIGDIEIGESVKPDDAQKQNLELMGFKDFEETKVTIKIKTSKDCLLMAIENMNPMADSDISCDPLKEGARVDQKYVKRTLMTFPPKRVMASAILVKAGQEFLVAGSVIKAKANGKEFEVGHLRDASEVK